eukprot:gene29419-51416_t
MKAYVRSPYFSSAIRNAGKDHGLVDALYKKGELKLEYDAASTRDAGAKIGRAHVCFFDDRAIFRSWSRR